jgi:hypothetical protein
MNSLKRLPLLSTLLAAAAALGVSTGAAADDFPAGMACDFTLRVEQTPGHALNFKEFFDRDGNLVKVLITGNSPQLVVTNLDTGASTTFAPKGQMMKITPNGDGTTTWVVTGHTLIVYFPGDEIGPAAIHYIGRVTFQADAANTFTQIRASGRQLDVCELLE